MKAPLRRGFLFWGKRGGVYSRKGGAQGNPGLLQVKYELPQVSPDFPQAKSVSPLELISICLYNGESVEKTR